MLRSLNGTERVIAQNGSAAFGNISRGQSCSSRGIRHIVIGRHIIVIIANCLWRQVPVPSWCFRSIFLNTSASPLRHELRIWWCIGCLKHCFIHCEMWGAQGTIRYSRNPSSRFSGFSPFRLYALRIDIYLTDSTFSANAVQKVLVLWPFQLWPFFIWMKMKGHILASYWWLYFLGRKGEPSLFVVVRVTQRCLWSGAVRQGNGIHMKQFTFFPCRPVW